VTDPTNPFGALTLIAAPAVLTNASSILVLSTSNRLARAVDRARALTASLELPHPANDPFGDFRFREVGLSEQRALMLLRALRFFYSALAGFAASAFVSLVGAAAGAADAARIDRLAAIIGVGTGLLAVGSLVVGCVVLLRETKIAVDTVSEETALLREHRARELLKSRDRES
jgi:hypothetical protein